MSILEEIEEGIRKKECLKNNHEWDYETHHGHSTMYFCKHCPAFLVEPEDGIGA